MRTLRLPCAYTPALHAKTETGTSMEHEDNWTDKDIAEAFFRMLRTIVIWVGWMITIFWGIRKDLAFFDNPRVPGWEHVLFFVWLAATLPLLVWLTLRKIWHV